MRPSFLPLGTRYYNCVPFAGCVFVAPSKLYQPRVKTFEELPLEVHTQKAPQVSSCLSPHANLFKPAVTFWQNYRFDSEPVNRRRVDFRRTTRRTAGWCWPRKSWRGLNTSRETPPQRGLSFKKKKMMIHTDSFDLTNSTTARTFPWKSWFTKKSLEIIRSAHPVPTCRTVRGGRSMQIYQSNPE